MSAERARSFGAVAEEYEATRPNWPSEPFAEAFARFGVRPAADVADVAAGTGKLTRVLLPLAGTLVAVEPDDALRAVLERELPAVRALAGSAEALPLEDASADVVCAGQAFHWFDRERALEEIARVLRPGGVLVVAWYQPRQEGTWYDAVIDFLRVANPDHLPATTMDWPAAFSHPAYGELWTSVTPYEQPSDRARFERLLGTHSAINAQPPERRAELIEQAIAVAVEQGAFDAAGRCAIPWSCELYALPRTTA